MFATSLIRSSKRSTSFALSSLLTALLATSFVVLGGAVPASASACDAGVAEPTLNEDGDTYTIGTAAELIALSENFLFEGDPVWGEGFRFEQTANIDLDDCDWSPIGTADSPFVGVYDGQGFTVSGLKISPTTEGDVGFFGFVGDGSFIQEFTLIGEIDIPLGGLAGGSTVGGIAGYIAGETYISQVVADVDISTQSMGSGNVGGIVGQVEYGTIQYSAHRGTITVAGDKTVGGLVGYSTAQIELFATYSITTFDDTNLSGQQSAGIIGNGDCEAAIDDQPYVLDTFSVASGQYWGVQIDSCATYEDTFYNGTTFLGLPTSDTAPLGLMNESTLNMKKFVTYDQWGWRIDEGWEEFDRFSVPANIWGICSAVNDGYPYLLWEYSSNPCVPGGAGTSAIASSSSNSKLASTGSNLIDYSGLVAGFLIAGTGLVLLGRLRRQIKTHN